MGALYLHISQKDLSRRTAETTHVLELARALRTAGRTVRVVAPAVGRCGLSLPFPIDYLPALSRPRLLRLLSYEASLWIYLLTRPGLWRRRVSLYVRKGTALLAPVLLARILGLRVVLEVNEVTPEIAAHAPMPPAMMAAWRMLALLSYRLATAIVVPSDALAGELRASGVPAEKVRVVNNGVNPGMFYPRDEAACRRALGMKPEGACLCYTGALAVWQGLDTLLEAFARALPACPDAFLVLLGDGPMRHDLGVKARALGIEDRVLFRGPVLLEQVPQYVAAASVCAVPVTAGTHSPVKLFEYLACGKPVIGSDVAGVREVISAYGCGWLARPGDCGAWAEAIAAALAAPPEELRRRGEKGRRAVERNHTWQAAGDRVLPLLDSRNGRERERA